MSSHYFRFDRLRGLREAAGLSQPQFAKALKVSYNAYNAWELGKSLPDLTHFIALCCIFSQFCDCRPEFIANYLTGGDDIAFPVFTQDTQSDD